MVNSLEIIIPTYNRKTYLERTCKKLFDLSSPVRNMKITILDNNSTDDTQEYVTKLMKQFPNLIYKRNKFNIGLAGNIVKATELVTEDYFWILGDDDILDFTNWGEIQNALNEGFDQIYLDSNTYQREVNIIYEKYPSLKKKTQAERELINKGCLIAQFIFISGSIYRKSLIDDNTMKNLYDGIYTICPQAALFSKVINQQKKLYVMKKSSVVTYGYDGVVDASYTRGHQNTEVYQRIARLSFYAGASNAIMLIKDEKLRYWTMEYFLGYDDKKITFKRIISADLKTCSVQLTNIFDLCANLHAKQRNLLLRMFLLKSFVRLSKHRLKKLKQIFKIGD